jgi:RHS repeat-associated protein
MKGKSEVPRRMTNESGTVVWSATYYPFGEMTAGSANTHGFTGKEYDSEMGLNYFCQRYYDPQIGRFMTRDLIQQPVYSTYAYCVNNPLKYTDPLGLEPPNKLYPDYETGGYWYWRIIDGMAVVTIVAPIADEQIGSGDSPGAGEVESKDFPSFSQMIAIRSLIGGSEGNPGADINDETEYSTEGMITAPEKRPILPLNTLYALNPNIFMAEYLHDNPPTVAVEVGDKWIHPGFGMSHGISAVIAGNSSGLYGFLGEGQGLHLGPYVSINIAFGEGNWKGIFETMDASLLKGGLGYFESAEKDLFGISIGLSFAPLLGGFSSEKKEYFPIH